jgi:hypothetical protein
MRPNLMVLERRLTESPPPPAKVSLGQRGLPGVLNLSHDGRAVASNRSDIFQVVGYSYGGNHDCPPARASRSGNSQLGASLPHGPLRSPQQSIGKLTFSLVRSKARPFMVKVKGLFLHAGRGLPRRAHWVRSLGWTDRSPPIQARQPGCCAEPFSFPHLQQ